MTALINIGWFLWLIVSIALVFDAIGMRLMVVMFPEGWRWWQLPVQLASLAFFAAAVLCNPWR